MYTRGSRSGQGRRVTPPHLVSRSTERREEGERKRKRKKKKQANEAMTLLRFGSGGGERDGRMREGRYWSSCLHFKKKKKKWTAPGPLEGQR